MESNNFSQFGMAQNEVKPLNFGETISAEVKPQYTTLPEGDYEFTVKSYNVSDYAGSDKLPPCKCFTVDLIIDGKEKGVGFCRTNFYLTSKIINFLTDFFVCVGKLPPLTNSWTLSIDMLNVTNLKGMAHFNIRKYSAKEYQNLKYCLPPNTGVDQYGRKLPF